MMSSQLTLPVLAFFVLCMALSQGFVRYSVVREKLPQWRAAQKCRDQGQDGLAVINTPHRWRYAKLQLTAENLPSTQEVWIGLGYNTVERKPVWPGGQNYTWGAWGTGQPDWLSTAVVVTRQGADYVWRTRGSNYENMLLCSKETAKLRMMRHPNRNASLSGVTALVSEAHSVVEDCGALCGSLAACVYFSYSQVGGACSLYDQSVNATLAVDSGSPSTLLVYQIAS